MKLNPKQQKFAELYVQTGNAAASYLQAGYASKSDEANRANAARLITNDNVSAYINDLRQIAAKESEKTIKDIVKEMEKIAFGDLNTVAEIKDGEVVIKEGADINSLDGLSVSNSKSYSSEGSSKSHSFSVKKSDKLKALIELAKIKGAYDSDKGDSGSDLTNSAERILDALRGIRKK